MADSGTGDAVKHPLQTRWCFWLRNNQGGKSDWSQQQTLGHTFATVEDFWCMINNINNPFEGNHISVDYSIFREGLVPDYEQPALKAGGRIIIKLNSTGVRASQTNFEVWVHLLLALIGENFDDVNGEHAAGLRIVVKRGNAKLEVWTTSKETEKMEPLVKGVVQLLSPMVERCVGEFEAFDKSATFKLSLDR